MPRLGRLSAATAAILSLFLAPQVSAVDRSKFRTCEQGSFCRRFKKWVARPQREEALWSVLPGTKTSTAAGAYTFQVQHKNEAAAHLLLALDFYSSGVVRVRLNEIDPVYKRHVIPAGDCVAEAQDLALAQDVAVAEEGSATVFAFRSAAGSEVQAKLVHSPFAVSLIVDGIVVQRLNDRNTLNFERYRTPKEDRPPDAMAKTQGVTLDAAYHPHDLDTKGLWEEDFGGHTDKKPHGPASLGMDVTFAGEVPNLFGLPEHATKAALPFYEEPYRFFNLDVFEYEIDEPMALYGAVPLLWAIHRAGGKSVASGFLWINPSETFVKLERGEEKGPAQSWWVSESGVIDIAMFAGPTPRSVSSQFHSLTGLAPLPPLWALGKHQCRWNYMSQKDVLTVDSSYDKYDIPYDVIWLDIEHTDGKAYFTWNKANFPDPSAMMGNISAKRRKFVNVVDPHIKKDDNFHVYKEVRDQGLFVKKIDWRMMDDAADVKPADWVETQKIADPEASAPEVWNVEEDGEWEPPKIDNPAYKGAWTARQITDPNSPMTDFEGWCWPGTSLYPDFTDPKMRDYWGSQFALDKYEGTNADLYVWNDMNEPSVFNGPEVTMPRDAIHPNGDVEHRELHNMYGYYVHRATFEGLAKRVPGDRPFVLTRSFFVGSHKYAAIWTGDNYAKWEHLQASIAMVGALTLGGQSLVGADVGGFFKHPDAEMVTRWYQLAVLAYPFLRNHAHLETPRREPYMYDDVTMLRTKAALQLRYKMLPIWYTLFQEYATTGAPVVRPLFWDFLEDAQTHENVDAVENQIMLGDIVLVHGVAKPMADASSVNVYLPQSPGWYDLYSGVYFAPGAYKVIVTMESIPTYYRAGTIVPLKSRIRRSSACTHLDPFTLSVYLDPATGQARGRLYIDDYKTQSYKDGKSSLTVEFEYKNGVLSASSTTGTLPDGISAEIERVEVHGLKEAPTKATYSSKSESAQFPFYKGVVKVQPWIDLRKPWKLEVA